MIKLRLKRFGKKREASFRLVACNSTSRRDGRPLQELGFYNPRTKETRLDAEGLRERLSQGAQPTDAVRSLLEKGGLLEKTIRPAETVGKAKQAAAREAAAKQAAKEAAEAKAAAEGRDEIVPGQDDESPLLAMIPFNIEASKVLDLVRELRASGVRVEIELRTRKIGKAMGWADSIGSSYALVVGPRDLEQGQATVKRLADGEQLPVALNTESILSALNA